MRKGAKKKGGSRGGRKAGSTLPASKNVDAVVETSTQGKNESASSSQPPVRRRKLKRGSQTELWHKSSPRAKRAKATKAQEDEPEYFMEKRHLWDQLESLYEFDWDFTNLEADLVVNTKIQLMAEKPIFKSDTDFVKNNCRRFVVILHVDCTSSNESTSSSVILASSTSKSCQSSESKQLDPWILLDALVSVLANENRVHSKSSLIALNVFSETLLFQARVKYANVLMAGGGHNASVIVSSPSTNPLYSPHPSVRIPVFEQLLPQLLHGSYGSTWQAHVGGVIGLGTLVGKVNVESLSYVQVKIKRGLVEVLVPVYASKEPKETSQVLMQILGVVDNVDASNSEARRNSFQDVIGYLVSGLLNPKASIPAVLAGRTVSEVTELLEPSYPLQCKTVEQQVGTIAALIFCRALKFLSTTIAWINFRVQTYTDVPAKMFFILCLFCRAEATEPKEVESGDKYIWIVIILGICFKTIMVLWRCLRMDLRRIPLVPTPPTTPTERNVAVNPKRRRNNNALKPEGSKSSEVSKSEESKSSEVSKSEESKSSEVSKSEESKSEESKSEESKSKFEQLAMFRYARERTNVTKVGKLVLGDVIELKERSEFAIVQGFLEKRPVYIKCGVKTDEMQNEVDILQFADHHPNILRYFSSEIEKNYFYYAVEPWLGNLTHLVNICKTNEASLEIAFGFSSAHPKMWRTNEAAYPKLWTANGAASILLRNLIRDVVLGLEHLHSLDIIHRDLRPKSIMIIYNGKRLMSKIDDMGVAEELNPDFPPNDEEATVAGDMFALGSLIYYLLSRGSDPFRARKPISNMMINSYDKRRVNFPDALHLINCLLGPKPHTRASSSFFWNDEKKIDFLHIN
ncbi:PREDICTED: uncharacterized protein LOC104779791 [Camelina sativa]|uniref:Uncharacterized protein LOC104779791 n=1 Tax=Camelina sativa TaxID=90675 RepID=A0ABM1RM26_CAMSA|nr:PREDICTED: uncharacterized protein LOC104779791 [Camelina sativa]